MPPFDLEKHSVVESLENVPEGFRGIYEEQDDGTFQFAEHARELIQQNIQIRKALQKERKLKTPTADYSALADYGTTPEELADAFRQRDDHIAELSKKRDIDPAKIRADADAEFTRKYQKQIDDANSLVTNLTQQLEQVMVANEIAAVANEFGGPLHLWAPILKQSLRTEYEEDRYHVFVVDQDGERRYNVNSSYMTIRDLAEEMERDSKYAALFPSKTANGTGTPSPRQSPTERARAAENLKGAQKINYALNERNRRRA
jgi:uncharacterized phage infection (PIP) family protein YhgE